MTYKQKINDPRQLAVQLNVSMPWAFRQYLRQQAEEQRISLNKVALDALYAKHGKGYEAAETEVARQQTSQAGATT